MKQMMSSPVVSPLQKKGKEKSITSEFADSALLQIKVDYGETKAFIVLSREPTQEALWWPLVDMSIKHSLEHSDAFWGCPLSIREEPDGNFPSLLAY